MRINPIARFAVERRVTMSMAVMGIIVMGWLSLTRLPLEFLPAFASSNIWVRAPYESSSPEEVERLIVRPLEDILGTVNGIDTLTATASANQGSVSISFLDGTDMDLAAVEVRDRIDRVRNLLPDDLRRVEIRRFQSSDIPVLRFHLSADWGKDRLYDFVENVLQRRLERLEGVAQIEIRGLKRESFKSASTRRACGHTVWTFGTWPMFCGTTTTTYREASSRKARVSSWCARWESS